MAIEKGNLLRCWSALGRSCVIDVGVERLLLVPVIAGRVCEDMLVNATCSLLGRRSRMYSFSRWNDGVNLRGVWRLQMQVLLSVVRAQVIF